MPQKTILVVDDDPDQAELMALMLRAADRRVHAYSDPFRALTALTDAEPDLLIADLSMPWIDGQDMISLARTRRPRLPIVLISGYSRGAEIAARQGLRFFAKPLNFLHLRDEVERIFTAR